MKFCKNLQRVAEISDPEWAPYWINYKQLKKLIKEIVSTSPPVGSIPTDSNRNNNTNPRTNESSSPPVLNRDSQAESSPSTATDNGQTNGPRPAASAATVERQSQGDETSERRQAVGQQSEDPNQSQNHQAQTPRTQDSDMLLLLGQNAGERAFFKLLHSEVKKSTHFFENAQKEYIIREERVRKGMEIIKSEQDQSHADEHWSRCAQSIFRLYRELLLLETFAIMTYCGFSKILKKHDKNTGFSTRNAFMVKIVNQANFVNYPQLLQMINRCERLYEEVSTRLALEGKNNLHEDERLFIHMIHRLNAQVTGDAKEGSSGKVPGDRTHSQSIANMHLPSRTFPFCQEAWKAHSLKELVAENDSESASKNSNKTHDDDDSDSDAEDVKPKAKAQTENTTTGKRGPDPPDLESNPPSKKGKA